jgi:uncharacterized membrane protein
MMESKTLTGAVLAAAVGAMFLASPAFAQSPSSSGSGTAASQVKCIGGNSCKGQSSCASASNSCMGQNSCKGKGWVTTASVKECTDKGGHPAEPKKS